MTATQLLADLSWHGIELVAHGDRLRYRPRLAVTPDLAERLRTHKPELLAILRPPAVPDAPTVAGDPENRPEATPEPEKPDAMVVWQRTLDRLKGDPLFPTDLMESLRTADVRWAPEDSNHGPGGDLPPRPLGPDASPADCIDPPDPCPKCDGLVFWWNAWDDPRCMACDPPITAIRLLQRAERIRRRLGISSPAGAAEKLADLKRLVSQNS